MSLYLIDDTNLIPFPYYERSYTSSTGITWTVNSDGSITANGTATAEATFYLVYYKEETRLPLPAGDYYFTSGSAGNKICYGRVVVDHPDRTHTNVSDYGSGGAFTINEGDSIYVLVRVCEGATVSNFTFEPMLNKGPTAKPFRPYRNPVKVQAMDVRDWDCAEVSGSFTDRSTANGLDIIDGKNARLDKIGGSTVKSANLIPYPFSTTDRVQAGVTFSSKDGVFTANGTATSDSNMVLALNITGLPAGTYTYSGVKNGGTSTFYIQAYVDDVYQPAQTTVPVTIALNEGQVITRLVLFFKTGTVFNNVVIKPMLNKGDTALPFRPYFSGLKNSSFKGLKSVGKNLIPHPYINKKRTVAGITFESDEVGRVSITGKNTGESNSYFIMARNLTFPAGKYMLLNDNYVNNAKLFAVINGTYYGPSSTPLTFNTDFVVTRFYIDIDKGTETTFNGDIVYPMFCRSTTILPFEPYKESLYELPEGIELGQWDSFNPKTGELTVGTRTIAFDGTEDWTLQSTNAMGLANFQVSLERLSSGGGHIVCNLYSYDDFLIADAKSEGIHLSPAILFIRTLRFATADEWKTHLAELYAAGNPLKVAYQLATPEVIKLPDIPKRFYTAWNGGREILMPGTEDNSIYGAIPTVTATYKAKTDEEIVVLKDIKIKESNIE